MYAKAMCFVVVALCLLVTACSADFGPASAPEVEPPPEEDAETKVTSEEAIQPTGSGDLFSEGSTCATCHTNMVDESGEDVSIDAFWRSTMMANSARDPYWQATVRSEVLTNPHLQSVIEDKCAQCHMPMANVTTRAAGGEGQILDEGFLSPSNDLNALAMDGVSCSVCHQIQQTNFGEHESFDGEFIVDLDTPAGERAIFGPFSVDETQTALMQSVSGFVPVQSEHVQESELCATCHTLFTPYVDAAGEVVGIFPEQTPYLEWLNSDYADTVSCQDCHMPQAEGGVVLSITGGEPRSNFSQHAFVGGNTFMREVFLTFGEERMVTASAEDFDATTEHALDLMQNRTATVALEDAQVSGTNLSVAVSIESLVGHKLPSGYPSRRTWLHLTVRDASDQVVFESGAVNPDGSITGNDNDADAAVYEPHYLTITNSDQVQIYEAIMADTDSNVTTRLLRASRYLKDNRLLPSGFDVDGAGEDVAVFGLALEDEDFLGGGDTVIYEIDLAGAQGPFTVTAELLYQSIGYRWAQNLGENDAEEIATFLSYYESVPNMPILVSSDTVEVAP
jgi:hypothetical protein